MKLKLKNANSVLLLIGILFSVIGTAFLVAGIAVLIIHNTFMDNAVQTEAEITLIESESYRRNGKTHTDHDVWVEYEIDGEVYEEELGYYNSGMNEGDKIDVYYDPDNPSDVSSGSKILELIFILIGGVFAVLGVILIIVNILSGNRRKKLMQTGERLTGTITDVVMNNAVRINGHHPFKAECEVINPFDGEKYLYSSENVTCNISELVGREVTVYVDRNNKKKYYVDIFELMDKYKEEENIHDYR